MRKINHIRQRSRNDHSDDWLMTYADLITLLLCFFAIFLSMSMPKKSRVEQVTTEMAEPMSIPDLLAGNFPTHKTVRPAKSEDHNLDAYPAIVDAFKAEAEKEKTKQQDEPKGQRLTTFELNSAAFFTRGSATLSETGRGILANVAETLKDAKFKDYLITVEGHTDDIPVSTPQFPSNWELSTARAAAVVRYFLEQGISPQKLRAAGYADTFPKVPNRDSMGQPIPDNQAQNRRVVIRMEKIDINP